MNTEMIEKKVQNGNLKETVVNNPDGTITRTRCETREIKDENGNVIGQETRTYTETVMGDEKSEAAKKPEAPEATKAEPAKEEKGKPETQTIFGLTFGETPAGADQATDVPGEPALKMFKFTPAKKLDGFDDYYAFVTPKTHKLVKVCACAKEAVDGGAFNRRHWLVEALESRYHTQARLASWVRPLYVLDIAPQRGVSICLASASNDYETVITAWDDEAAELAASELRELRDEAYRAAVEKRNQRIQAAVDVF